MVEQYFSAVSKRYYAGEEMKDCKPEYFFQTGVTPEGMERARCHKELVDSLPEEDKPLSEQPPVKDAKWRFFWKIGERPPECKDEIPQTYPEDFPQWETEMNKWGFQMLDCTFVASEMAAIGMGLDKDTFTSRMH